MTIGKTRADLWAIFAAAILTLMAPSAHAVNMDAIGAKTPPVKLSAYGFFDDPQTQSPAAGVVPYDLITPLFTDYAQKRRFLYVPEGKQISYDATQVFTFPEGSALIKTFAYPMKAKDANTSLRLIETRLLIRKPQGWAAYPYVWNEAGTDATLKRAGKRIPLTIPLSNGETAAINYQVPNVNQCKGCHVQATQGGAKAVGPIGPKARNLNHAFTYPQGSKNQLTFWQELGWLKGAPAAGQAPRVPRWDDPDAGSLNDRARAYLDVNCGHCHQAGGPAATSGLMLDWGERNPAKLGFYKRPVAAGRGSAGLEFSVVPGAPDKSILAHRMASTDPGVMMPELGRTLAHREGVNLIRQWIAAQDPADYD